MDRQDGHKQEAEDSCSEFELSEVSDTAWGLAASAVIHALLAIEERLGQIASR